MDYDSMFPGVQIVAPHTDARGSYEAGTHAVTGIGTPCRTVPYQVADAIAYPSSDPENPPPPHADSVQVCVKVDYPAAKQWMTYKPRNTSQTGAYAWWGSLITGGRDASGQMYMRNRYYDPGSGRFTQEDPIGLAGGLNLYGFAEGDPVNFSDPYGLCTKKDGWKDCDKMVTKEQGRSIFAASVRSGEWRYTQGGAQGGEEPAKNYNARLGDCTDFTWFATRSGLKGLWNVPFSRAPRTATFRNGTPAGYTEVEANSAQMGDVVVRGGHAGIFVGFDSGTGEPVAFANNGSPAYANRANVDRTTGDWLPARGSRQAPRYFRAIID